MKNIIIFAFLLLSACSFHAVEFYGEGDGKGELDFSQIQSEQGQWGSSAGESLGGQKVQ